MLKEVDKNTWDITLDFVNHSIFDQSDYLETIALLFRTKVHYWIIYKNEQPIIGFATHVRKTSIIVPDHFSYSSFWRIAELGEFSFFDHLEQAIAILKKQFRFISFRLPPCIKDIRAFNLHDFSSTVRYTYINETSQLDFRRGISSKIKRADNLNWTFSYNDSYEENLNQQLHNLKTYGFKEEKIRFYKRYFSKLIENGFLKSFNLKMNEKLMSSSLVIYDLKNSFAYNILLSNNKNNYKNGEGGYFYLQMMNTLKGQGISRLDLYGANMKGIANFKSGLNGELLPYYCVNYGFMERYPKEFITGLKKVVLK